ncbi:MAG: FimV/HubP family polar landmark protein [Gammaproteobacteria bacterium]
MKHLTKTLAVISLLAPITAQPLGIGDIKLHSTLNQKLNAEIRLLLAPGDNPDEVSVRLASPEKFDKAGIPWNYNLSKIKFKTVTHANGSMAIEVFSREAITEPFLDFLLEVTWPQGTQFREFTLLLDPPADYLQPVIPVVANAELRAQPLTRTAKAVRKAKPSAARPQLASHITPQTPTDGEYGPIQSADNLWSIAKQLGEERGVPTNKMMHALFQANPDAFGNSNINILKVGSVLKIPETEAILKPGSQRTEAKTAAKPTPPATKTVAATSKALELEAPTEAKVPETAVIDEHSKPGGEAGQPGATSTEGAPSGEADLALQDRIDRLEQQLNMMQQLLALKDQQLSALQSGDQQRAEQAAQQAQQLPEQTPETKPTVEQAVPEQKPVPTPPPVEPKPTPAPPPPAAAPKPRPVPTPPLEPESETSPLYYLTVGGLSFGILGALGWLWWRRRTEDEQPTTDSMFASASQIRLPDSDSSLSVPVIDMNTAGSYDVGTVGESSFISDFTPSDFEAFDTDQGEVDPMSEADVYLAYGRYQQAEDLMRQAIEEQPDKDDYKLKLLEIFYANENKERFAEYASKLADAGKNADRHFWNKVLDMAKEIMPESPIIGGSAATGQAKPEAVKSEKQTAELAPKPEPVEEEAEPESDFDLGEDDNSLDFDLDTFAEKKPPEKTEDKKPTSTIESIDFDLGDLSEPKPEKKTEKSEKPSDALETFDFNFDFGEDDSAESKAEPSSGKSDLDMESLDFSGLGGVDEEQEPVWEKDETDKLSSNESNDFDFNFDFEAPKSEGKDEELDLGVSDLTDMDEFETKIDLAKAYIDMGDTDAAKNIAEEVLAKGSKEQQQAAQAILDEIK